MSDETKCECSAAPTLIFPCSGGSDVGALTDQAARKLTMDKNGKMFCLAGIGGRVSGIMKTTEAAERIIVIDGCPLDCAKKCMENAGFSRFDHINLADIGLTKGCSAVSEENIASVAAKCAEYIDK